MSEYELGSYAGALRAAAEVRRRERTFLRWVSLSQSAAGVVTLSLVAAMKGLNKSSRRNILIIGGIYTSVGLINFGTSFSETATERAWSSYEAQSPRGSVWTRLSLSPVIHEGGGGLALAGRF